MSGSLRLALLVSAVTLGPGVVRSETNSPEFLLGRHPAAGSKVHPPARWSATENVAWVRDIPGRGWSSPTVWGQRIFLTTCVNSGKDAEARKGLYLEDLDANKYPREANEHLYKVLCIDLAT